MGASRELNRTVNQDPQENSGSGFPDDIRKRLEDLADEAQLIASLLPTTAELPIPSRCSGILLSAEKQEIARVRRYLRMRRLRTELLPGRLFAEPAWDMLLDLYAARLENQDISISSACIAAAVPPTTALRWLKYLEEHKLVVRHDDAADRRRIYISLTDRATQAMSRWVSEALENW